MLTDAGVVGVFLLSDDRMFKTEYLPCSQMQV